MGHTSQYQANLERSKAKILDLETCITEQKKQIDEACDRMLSDHRSGKSVADELTFWQKRAKSLKAYYGSINDELVRQRDLIDKERERVHQDLRAEYQKMRGLTSYAIASGQGSPELQLLHASIGDVLDAKSDADRDEAKRTVDLTLKFAKFGNERSATSTPILDEYEAIRDPEDATAYFKHHEAEIKAEHDAKIGNIIIN